MILSERGKYEIVKIVLPMVFYFFVASIYFKKGNKLH